MRRQVPPQTSRLPPQHQAPGAESITNVQPAGADEGGIVKVHGDHLVVFTPMAAAQHAVEDPVDAWFRTTTRAEHTLRTAAPSL